MVYLKEFNDHFTVIVINL